MSGHDQDRPVRITRLVHGFTGRAITGPEGTVEAFLRRAGVDVATAVVRGVVGPYIVVTEPHDAPTADGHDGDHRA